MIVGLAGSDLTYRAKVLAYLESLVLHGWTAAEQEAWLSEALEAGADGVWLAEGPVDPDALDRMVAGAPIVAAAAESMPSELVDRSWPVAEAVDRPATEPVTGDQPGPQLFVVDPALDSPWEWHRHHRAGRALALLPPVNDLPARRTGTIESLESTESAAAASARAVGLWSLAVAQGVRVIAARDVAAARRTVDSGAEMLAGESGPVIVSLDRVPTSESTTEIR